MKDKRDQSNRICIDKALLPILQAEASKLYYEDISGIVNHILRLALSSQNIQIQTTPETVTSTPENTDEFEFDLAA